MSDIDITNKAILNIDLETPVGNLHIYYDDNDKEDNDKDDND
ncbi:hypothetical protein [Treponema sp. OMZ 787]|nr:hypothetical protein [Treponema sp. OMZ 787]